MTGTEPKCCRTLRRATEEGQTPAFCALRKSPVLKQAEIPATRFNQKASTARGSSFSIAAARLLDSECRMHPKFPREQKWASVIGERYPMGSTLIVSAATLYRYIPAARFGTCPNYTISASPRK